MTRLILFSLAVALAGCATPPEWRSVDDKSLCLTAGNWRWNADQHDLAVRELVRRGKARQRYADDIRNREIAIGMNSCEVIAAWGFPNDYNETIGKGIWRVQWVYGSYAGGSKPRYVYTQNDVVTSLQN